MAVSAALDRESEGERVVFVERSTFIDTVYRLGDRNGAGEALDLPTDAWIASATRLGRSSHAHDMESWRRSTRLTLYSAFG